MTAARLRATPCVQSDGAPGAKCPAFSDRTQYLLKRRWSCRVTAADRQWHQDAGGARGLGAGDSAAHSGARARWLRLGAREPVVGGSEWQRGPACTGIADGARADTDATSQEAMQDVPPAIHAQAIRRALVLLRRVPAATQSQAAQLPRLRAAFPRTPSAPMQRLPGQTHGAQAAEVSTQAVPRLQHVLHAHATKSLLLRCMQGPAPSTTSVAPPCQSFARAVLPGLRRGLHACE